MIPPIVVFTSDKYLHALRGFMYMFDRHWYEQPEVIVAGFSAPDFPVAGHYTWHSIGKFEDYPVNKWSDAVLDFLDQRPEIERFVLMLEDYWIVRRVNHYAIDILTDYMAEHPEVIKMDLCADRLYALGARDYAVLDWFDLIISDPDSQYLMSLMTGIWNVSALRRVLIRGESPWQVELEGTPRLAALRGELKVMGTRQWPLRHTLALRDGNPAVYKEDGIPPATLMDLKMRGFLDRP